MTNPHPKCPSCTQRAITVVTAETAPVEQVVLLCNACRDIIICTRLPGKTDWIQSIFKGVADQEALIEVIHQESWRLGLPKPKVTVRA